MSTFRRPPRDVELCFQKHRVVLDVFEKELEVKEAALAAVDILSRSFEDETSGIVIEPFGDPVCLFVWARSSLESVNRDFLAEKAIEEWETTKYAKSKRVSIGV